MRRKNMKRRMFALFLLLSLCLLCVLPAFAAEASLSGPSGRPLVVDNAGLLTAQEIQKLTSCLEEISARQAMDVAVVTTLSLDGKTERDYADDFYDYGGYADDGVLLHLATEEMQHLFDWNRVKREVTVIQPQFVVESNGRTKAVAVYAKSCRGAMTRHVIINQIDSPAKLLEFSYQGFVYRENLSSATNFVYVL